MNGKPNNVTLRQEGKSYIFYDEDGNEISMWDWAQLYGNQEYQELFMMLIGSFPNSPEEFEAWERGQAQRRLLTDEEYEIYLGSERVPFGFYSEFTAESIKEYWAKGIEGGPVGDTKCGLYPSRYTKLSNFL